MPEMLFGISVFFVLLSVYMGQLGDRIKENILLSLQKDVLAGQLSDSLARMAVATRSPQTYALAMRACQGQRGEGACQMLSADQWVQLDSGNAMLWLQVATDAQVRGDAAAVAEALYRASQATSADWYAGSIASMALAKLPADMRLPERGALAA
jgi:hypothetical protein